MQAAAEHAPGLDELSVITNHPACTSLSCAKQTNSMASTPWLLQPANQQSHILPMLPIQDRYIGCYIPTRRGACEGLHVHYITHTYTYTPRIDQAVTRPWLLLRLKW